MSLCERFSSVTVTWALVIASTACGAPPPTAVPTAKPTDPVDDCGVAEASRLEARGDLDGALVALEQCSTGPAVAARIDLFLALGELDLAKRAATELERVDASRRGRTKEVLAMRAPTETIAEARAAADRGTLAAAKGNEVEASRELARARHLYARITKEKPERVLLSSPSVGDWIGGEPSWRVGVDVLPVDEKKRKVAQAIGHFDPDLRVIELRLEDGGTWLAWPGHPKGYLHATENDLSVVEGDAVKHLEAKGRPTFSPDGSLLLIAGESTLMGFSTSSWQKRFEIPVHAMGDGRWLRGGSLYAETYEGLLLIDVTKGSVVFDRTDVYPAFSGTGAHVAMLGVVPSTTNILWQLEIRSLDALDKARTVKLDVEFTGAPIVELDDDKVVITEQEPVARGDFYIVEKATVMVASGAVRRPRPVPRREDEPPHHVGQMAKEHAHLVKAIGALVSRPRELLPSGLHTTTYDESTKTGLVAAMVGTSDGSCAGSMNGCYVPDPSVLLADARKGTRLAEVKIPVDGPFAASTLELSADERYALGCGFESEGGAAFVVEVATGKLTFTPPTGCYDWKADASGKRILIDTGVIDLSGPPVMTSVSSATYQERDALAKSKAVPRDGPGLYCRFGSVLAPIGVCPAAPSNPR